MSDLKTRPTSKSVDSFLDSVDNDRRRADSLTLLELMTKVTGEKAVLWGDSIVGFGSYHYEYDSGREGDWFVTGFAPRKANLVVYVMAGFSRYDELLGKLGKHKHGKSCLYINKLDDVDLEVLEELVRESAAYVRDKGPGY